MPSAVVVEGHIDRTRFMIDDYLLKLCLTDEALSAFCRGVSQVAYRPQKASELESIIGRLAVELGKAGISVDSSKRYLDLIRATIGFAASRAGSGCTSSKAASARPAGASSSPRRPAPARASSSSCQAPDSSCSVDARAR